MTLRPIIAVFVVTAACFFTPVAAQPQQQPSSAAPSSQQSPQQSKSPRRRSPRPNVRQCIKQIKALCPGTNGGRGIGDCIKQNASKLTPECRPTPPQNP